MTNSLLQMKNTESLSLFGLNGLYRFASDKTACHGMNNNILKATFKTMAGYEYALNVGCISLEVFWHIHTMVRMCTLYMYCAYVVGMPF